MSERGHGVGMVPAGMQSGDVEAQNQGGRETSGDVGEGAREVDAVPGIADVHARVASAGGGGNAEKGKKDRKGKKKKRPQHVDRIPPQTPVLAEEYRYCQRDQLMKPMRTHHCRLCATVSFHSIVHIFNFRFILMRYMCSVYCSMIIM